MNTQKTILIYNDADSKTCSAALYAALYKSFQHFHVTITIADRHSLQRNLQNLKPEVIILPEIMGEESFYSRHIPIQTRDLIKRSVFNGALLVSFCAAAYWMGETITYHPPHGETKFRKGKDVFNATSI